MASEEKWDKVEDGLKLLEEDGELHQVVRVIGETQERVVRFLNDQKEVNEAIIKTLRRLSGQE